MALCPSHTLLSSTPIVCYLFHAYPWTRIWDHKGPQSFHQTWAKPGRFLRRAQIWCKMGASEEASVARENFPESGTQGRLQHCFSLTDSTAPPMSLSPCSGRQVPRSVPLPCRPGSKKCSSQEGLLILFLGMQASLSHTGCWCLTVHSVEAEEEECLGGAGRNKKVTLSQADSLGGGGGGQKSVCMKLLWLLLDHRGQDSEDLEPMGNSLGGLRTLTSLLHILLAVSPFPGNPPRHIAQIFLCSQTRDPQVTASPELERGMGWSFWDPQRTGHLCFSSPYSLTCL